MELFETITISVISLFSIYSIYVIYKRFIEIKKFFMIILIWTMYITQSCVIIYKQYLNGEIYYNHIDIFLYIIIHQIVLLTYLLLSKNTMSKNKKSTINKYILIIFINIIFVFLLCLNNYNIYN